MSKVTDIKRKILFNYLIYESYEAGIILQSWEIKSIKKNGFNINGSYVSINEKNIVLINSHIKPIRDSKHIGEFIERRKRKLLLSKKEIIKIKNTLDKENLTIMPSSIYWKNNYIKLEINICAGKKKYDKREDARKKDFEKLLLKNNFI